MFRLGHADFVDISYASSAPLKLYDQSASQYAYYDVVTKAAERLSPGCADAVSAALDEAEKLIKKSPSVEDAVLEMNMCFDTVPEYITSLDSKHPWLHHHPEAQTSLSADVMMVCD